MHARIVRNVMRAAAALGAAAVMLLAVVAVAAAAPASLSQALAPTAPGTWLPGSSHPFTTTLTNSGGVTTAVATVNVSIGSGFNAPGVSGTPTVPGGTCTVGIFTTSFSCTIPAGWTGSKPIAFNLDAPHEYVPSFTIESKATDDADGGVANGDLHAGPYVVQDGGPSSLEVVPDPIDRISYGASAPWHVVIHNLGSGDAKEVGVQASGSAFFAPGITMFTSLTPSSGSCAAAPTQTVTCTIPVIPAGGTFTLDATIRGDDYGIVQLGALVTSKDDGGVDAVHRKYSPFQIVDGRTQDVHMAYTELPTAIPSGGAFAGTIAISNGGPDAVVPTDVLEVNLGEDVTLSAVTSPAGTCSSQAAPSTSFTCGLTIPPGGSTVVQLVGAARTLTGSDLTDGLQQFTSAILESHAFLPQVGNATRRISGSLQVGGRISDVDLQLASPASVQHSQLLAVTVTVANHGPSAAKDPKFTADLLPGTTWADGPAGCLGGARVTCNLPAIASGASTTLTFHVRGGAVGSKAGLSGAVSVDGADPVAANDTAQLRADVVADLPARIVARLAAAARQRLAKALASGMPVGVTCDRACTVTVQLEIPARQAALLHARKPKLKVVGTGRATRASAGTLAVTAKFTKRARTALRAVAGPLVVTEVVTVTSPAGTAYVVTRHVTLRH